MGAELGLAGANVKADRMMDGGSQMAAGLSGKLLAPARRLGRSALDLVYPPQCLACDTPVQRAGTLCPGCWRDAAFIHGLTCDKCGVPLPGEDEGVPVLCDDCLAVARPWGRGRAVMAYDGAARHMVLGLKYRDRHDLAAPAGQWLAQRARPLLRPDTVVAPVPLHWWRLLGRRYNQSALLSAALARAINRPHCVDLLRRHRFTGTQDGLSRQGRFDNLAQAMRVHPRRAPVVAGRHVLLVDDVMTSGATLAACTEACFQAGADAVDVLILARVLRMA